MKMFRNLSIFVLAFLSILVVSFYGCQKEVAQVSPKGNSMQDLQAELRGCEFSVVNLYYKLVNGKLPTTYTGFAVKPDKSTFTNVPIVWKGNRLTAEGTRGVISFLETTEAAERSKLRTVLGLAPIATDAREAHHVIPAQWWGHGVVQIAGLGGFHPTHGFNGVPLSKVKDGGLHGNHPYYNNWIKFQLDQFETRNSINSANHYYLCNNWVQCRLIPEAINRINSASYANMSVNDSFRILENAGFVYIGN
jgi:hypothetical protein